MLLWIIMRIINFSFKMFAHSHYTIVAYFPLYKSRKCFKDFTKISNVLLFLTVHFMIEALIKIQGLRATETKQSP